MHLVFVIKFGHQFYSTTIFSSSILFPHRRCCSVKVQCSTKFWNMTATSPSGRARDYEKSFVYGAFLQCTAHTSAPGYSRLLRDCRKQTSEPRKGHSCLWTQDFRIDEIKDFFRNPAWDFIIYHRGIHEKNKEPNKNKKNKELSIIRTSILSAYYCRRNLYPSCVFDLK